MHTLVTLRQSPTLSRALIAHHGDDSPLARAVGRDYKGWLSLAVYAAAVPVAFIAAWLAFAMYIAVAEIGRAHV